MSTHQQVHDSKNTDSARKHQPLPNYAVPPPILQLHPAAILHRARADPGSLTPLDVLQLQRTIGNKAVSRLLSEIAQRREHEDGLLQREPIQNRENTTGMPDEIKTKMEKAFNTDFSGIKIHANSQKAPEVGALAYTQGNDVHFAPGQFMPKTSSGQQLLGHELAHVEQQRAGKVKPTNRVAGLPVNDDPALEREADAMGGKAAQMKLQEAITKSSKMAVQKKNSTNHLPEDTKSNAIIQNKLELDSDDSKADDIDGHESGKENKARWPKKGELKGKAESEFESAIKGNKELESIYYGNISVQKKKNTSLVNQEVLQLLTDDKKIDSAAVQSGYYQYDYDAKGNIDDFGDNRSQSKPKGGNPIGSPVVNLDYGTTVSGTGEMRSGRIVNIVGASRSQHFSIADQINDNAPAERTGKWTWHHLTPKYQMVWVDMRVHGGFGHNGGFSLWQ
jgi:hypothetical protein